MPVDGAVRIRDVVATPLVVDNLQGGDAVVVGPHVPVQVTQSKLCAQRGRDQFIRVGTGVADVDCHVSLVAAVENGFPFRLRELARIVDLDDELFRLLRVVFEFGGPPCLVGRIVVQIERAGFANRVFQRHTTSSLVWLAMPGSPCQ